MFEKISLGFCLFREALAEDRLLHLFRQQIFRDRIATPTVMNLTNLQFDISKLNTDYRFIELKLDDLISQKWSYAVPSRRIKAQRNLKRGLRGFAVAEGSVIVGDVWCVAGCDGSPAKHPDLSMLGIECNQKEAYAMDMLISPTQRGNNLAVPLQRYLQVTLKSEGYVKVYGYYWNDNTPAMWMHRMLHFEELPKRKVARFIFLKKVELA
jgi:hypothetical protein